MRRCARLRYCLESYAIEPLSLRRLFSVKKWTVPVFLLLIYAFPFTFLAMYGDHAFGTVSFYFPLCVGLSVLCYLSIRRGQGWLMLLGNLVSFLSSREFLLRYQGEGWDVFFQPFTPMGFLTTVSVIALAAQVVWLCFDRKKQAAFAPPKRR